MRFLMLTIAVIYTALSFGQENEQLQIPITYVTGYGPFFPELDRVNFSVPPEHHPFYKSYNTIRFTGIPAKWKNVQKGLVFIDQEQWVYQNYQLGHISPEAYKQVAAGQQMHLSNRNLAKDSIACIVLVVKGTDEQGNEKILVDYNNNADFSDETPYTPQTMSSPSALNDYVQYAKNVKYQIAKSSFKQLPLLILKYKDGYIYSFPQYAISTLKQHGKVYKIAESHKFRFPGFWDFDAGIYSGTSFKNDELVRRGEFITIGNIHYYITGININKGVLLLTKHHSNEAGLQSSQIGFPAIAFSGKDILTDKAVALNNFKGKYVFVDFWGSWCIPCIAEIPQLKTLYAKINSSKIDFIGIAGNDNLAAAKKVISDRQIYWPNILSDNKNLIVEKYHNLKYPTGFLIDPDGKILSNDLSTSELEARLKELKLLR